MKAPYKVYILDRASSQHGSRFGALLNVASFAFVSRVASYMTLAVILGSIAKAHLNTHEAVLCMQELRVAHLQCLRFLTLTAHM